MTLPDVPAERHRQVAGLFTDRVRGTRSWDAPAPVEGWAARDVVRHLTEWFPGFLSSGAGIDLRRGPSVDEDPVTAWQVHSDAVQEVLDDPETEHRELDNPQIGTRTSRRGCSASSAATRPGPPGKRDRSRAAGPLRGTTSSGSRQAPAKRVSAQLEAIARVRPVGEKPAARSSHISSRWMFHQVSP